MIKSPSPKIIFIPFLICSLSMVGKSIARIMNKEKMEFIFGKMFTLGFLLFFIGFLIFAGYVSIRDKNYSLLIFSIPFWLIGIFLIRKRFLNKNGEKDSKSIFPFAFIVSALLVAIALLAGVFLLVFGIKEANFGLILGGNNFYLRIIGVCVGSINIERLF